MSGLEMNQIHNMDCIEGMRQLKDDCIDLTVTSPPYDDLRTYNGYSFDFENVAKELYRITKPGGVVVWVVGDMTKNGSESLTSFKQALYFKEIGFNVHDTMIYKKNGVAFPDTVRYYQNFEYMFVLSKGKPKTVNLINDRKNKWSDGGKKMVNGTERQPDGSLKRKKKKFLKTHGVRYNVWEYTIGFNKVTKDKIAYKHPAIFPEGLARDHIRSWSNPGDIVLDPFMGSGTTAKMAILNDRNWIGFEISEEYAALANQRLKSIAEQMAF